VSSTSTDCVAKMHQQMSSAGSRTDAAGKPVTSLDNGICLGVTPPSSTQISLDTLFKGASRHCDSNEVNLLRLLQHLPHYIWESAVKERWSTTWKSWGIFHIGQGKVREIMVCLWCSTAVAIVTK